MTIVPELKPRRSRRSQRKIPRPEYPRPQFTRVEWMKLNGQWEFEFDDANVGLSDRWASSSRPFQSRIEVPFSFETAMSGIGDHSFHSCVWYRRDIAIPPEWSGRRILLYFGAVDYREIGRAHV